MLAIQKSSKPLDRHPQDQQFFSEIPKEIFRLILEFGDVTSHAKFSLTCKELKDRAHVCFSDQLNKLFSNGFLSQTQKIHSKLILSLFKTKQLVKNQNNQILNVENSDYIHCLEKICKDIIFYSSNKQPNSLRHINFKLKEESRYLSKFFKSILIPELFDNITPMFFNCVMDNINGDVDVLVDIVNILDRCFEKDKIERLTFLSYLDNTIEKSHENETCLIVTCNVFHKHLKANKLEMQDFPKRINSIIKESCGNMVVLRAVLNALDRCVEIHKIEQHDFSDLIKILIEKSHGEGEAFLILIVRILAKHLGDNLSADTFSLCVNEIVKKCDGDQSVLAHFAQARAQYKIGSSGNE